MSIDTQLRQMERYVIENPGDRNAAFQFEVRKWQTGQPSKFDWGCRICSKTDDLRPILFTEIRLENAARKCNE